MLGKVEAQKQLRSAFSILGKFTILFTSGIFMFTTAAYYQLIALRYSLVDALLPLEVALTVVLGFMLLGWSFKSVYGALKKC